jgi:phospholipid-binding lipoprotein MlaA
MARAHLQVRKFLCVMALIGGFAVTACAPTGTPEQQEALAETRDPIEPFNRGVFEVNKGLDTLIFKPVAWWYRLALPDPVQDSVRNFLANLRLPWSAVNTTIQGEWEQLQTTVIRFAINSTLGIAGLFDPATDWGYLQNEEDFGLTMAKRFGVGEGFYLVLPVFGPSNARDAVGLLVDSIADPVNLALNAYGVGYLTTVRGGVTGIDARARNLETIDQLEKSSVDFYATIRSIYRQRRENEIRGSDPTGNFPSFGVY